MRQWMVDPKILCRQHLMGEHNEHHMFVGVLKKKVSVKGYLEGNLLEPKSLIARHEDLAREMLARGFNHESPLDEPDLSYLAQEDQDHKLNKQQAEIELFQRCAECQIRCLALEATKRG